MPPSLSVPPGLSSAMAALSGVHHHPHGHTHHPALNPYASSHLPSLHGHLPLSMFTPPSIVSNAPDLSSLPPPAPPTPNIPIGASTVNGLPTTPGVTSSPVGSVSTVSLHSQAPAPLPSFIPATASTESILQSSQDLLRRELNARFLASQDRSISIGPPPYMRPSSVNGNGTSSGGNSSSVSSTPNSSTSVNKNGNGVTCNNLNSNSNTNNNNNNNNNNSTNCTLNSVHGNLNANSNISESNNNNNNSKNINNNNSSSGSNSSNSINGNNSLLPTNTTSNIVVPSLYDGNKLSKLDASLVYNRNLAATFLSSTGHAGAGLLAPPLHHNSPVTSLSLTNGSSSGLISSVTPSTGASFTSPGHVAAFQPKIGSSSARSSTPLSLHNSSSTGSAAAAAAAAAAASATISISATKCKVPNSKAGRWCAMHVRVST